MEIKIKNIEKKYYVDEVGLYYDLLVDVIVKPKVALQVINVDILIIPN